MWKAMLRRMFLAGLTVMLGGLLSATLVRYAPGFGADEQQLDARLSSASLAVMRNAAAGERAVGHYYIHYLQRVLRGDLGFSRSLNRPVRELLAERASVTCQLAMKAMLLAWLAAFVLVFATNVLRLSALSLCSTLFSGALLCLPAGALALLSILVNAPGYLPLALILFPKVHRYLRNLTMASVAMPHVLMARAQGLSQIRILLRHTVPVMRREVLALVGVSVGLAISAAIPVEALCGIPGIGQLAWQAALARDLPVLTNLSILIVAVVTLANASADVLGENRRQPV
jgi:peptide/nickel transport system permease protein